MKALYLMVIAALLFVVCNPSESSEKPEPAAWNTMALSQCEAMSYMIPAFDDTVGNKEVLYYERAQKFFTGTLEGALEVIPEPRVKLLMRTREYEWNVIESLGEVSAWKAVFFTSCPLLMERGVTPYPEVRVTDVWE